MILFAASAGQTSSSMAMVIVQTLFRLRCLLPAVQFNPAQRCVTREASLL